MKKGMLAAVAVVIVAVVLGVFFGLRKTDDKATITDKDTTSSVTSTTKTTQSTTSASNEVEIEDFTFKEKTLTVKKGTKVTWTNKDTVGHTVTFDDTTMSGSSSGTLNNGETFSYTFETTGTFAYHCTPHPEMTGTVIVTE